MKKAPLPMQDMGAQEKDSFGKAKLEKLLKQHFGYSEFRGKQLEAIEAVLAGRDCFCLMPTGGGKSMCYQIPALAKSGIVLVVSPLIALMENQVAALKEKRIPAEFLSSSQTSHVKEKIHEDLDSGKPSIRLLYVTPELIATAGFMSKLKKLYARCLLTLIAIDEAHCISSWGHDFRPSYRNLSSLRNHLSDVPILALTATAVPKVQNDVIGSLCLRSPLVLRASFNRPNIFYEVRYKDLLGDVYSDLSNILKASKHACAIVYCLERSTCDDLSAYLSKSGIACAAYHAGLNNKLRSSVLDGWMSSQIQVVVATVAFGMGIDRKDVRIVGHLNIPKSMEAFYQESGRAGRDQMPSRSVLYYGLDDRRKMEFILSNSRSKKSQTTSSSNISAEKSLSDFSQMVEYCEDSGCRRKKILDCFGEKVLASFCRKTCDACKHPNLVSGYLEELTHASSIHQKRLCPIFINSSLTITPKELDSEFWNRDDEASHLDEEDISESDDDTEVFKSLARSKLSSRTGLEEKLNFLEHAEEEYYQKKGSNKTTGADKRFISPTLREASKQRLLNALRQASERLVNLEIDLDVSATVLENECYKKYGKAGKTFYNSQVASTIRWLSSSSNTEISDRVGSNSAQANESSGMGCPPSTSASLPKPADEEQKPIVMREEEDHDIPSEAPIEHVKMEQPTFKKIELPLIPSFSEFVNKKEKDGKSDLSSASRRSFDAGTWRRGDSGKLGRSDAEKRPKLQ